LVRFLFDYMKDNLSGVTTIHIVVERSVLLPHNGKHRDSISFVITSVLIVIIY
jgi:hypothetical protein